MAYKSLSQFVETLERAGELVRIREYVNPHLQITEIVDRVSKTPDRNKALLFENTGTGFPLLINSMGSYRRMCMALGVESMDDITREIEGVFHELTGPKDSIIDKLKLLPRLGQVAGWMPKVQSSSGACQEVVMREPDLSKLPIMHCWPADGGRYITLPAIHTKDPHTGARNIGMYRVQVLGQDHTALHWQLHKVSRRHFEEYRKLGKRMPVAIALGGDPVFTYAGTAPLPDGIDEYILAGFIRKKRVNLVRCITQPDIEVPADADIIIEGYVDTTEDLVWEGPFGDHTGFYSLADWYPGFHVTAITHRRDAIYPSTIVGIPPQEDAWIGKATERIFLAPLKMTMVPEIRDMDLPIEGVFHNMALVQIEKDFPGQGLKVMNSLWGAGQMMFTKMMVITDTAAPFKDYRALARYLSQQVDPLQDVVIGQGPIDVLDHSCSAMAFGGKLGIDGTRKDAAERPAALSPTDQWPDPARPIVHRPDPTALIAEFPEIERVNDTLLDDGISILFLGVRKDRTHHIRTLSRKLGTRADFRDVKFVLWLDQDVPIDLVEVATWRFCNNVDVKRDSHVVENDQPGYGTLFLDGTRKTRALDGFQRDWPNVLVMDPQTIAEVDALWPRLGLGPLIPSPSHVFRSMVYGDGAVAEE